MSIIAKVLKNHRIKEKREEELIKSLKSGVQNFNNEISKILVDKRMHKEAKTFYRFVRFCGDLYKYIENYAYIFYSHGEANALTHDAGLCHSYVDRERWTNSPIGPSYSYEFCFKLDKNGIGFLLRGMWQDYDEYQFWKHRSWLLAKIERMDNGALIIKNEFEKLGSPEKKYPDMYRAFKKSYLNKKLIDVFPSYFNIESIHLTTQTLQEECSHLLRGIEWIYKEKITHLKKFKAQRR